MLCSLFKNTGEVRKRANNVPKVDDHTSQMSGTLPTLAFRLVRRSAAKESLALGRELTAGGYETIAAPPPVAILKPASGATGACGAVLAAAPASGVCCHLDVAAIGVLHSKGPEKIVHVSSLA